MLRSVYKPDLNPGHKCLFNLFCIFCVPVKGLRNLINKLTLENCYFIEIDRWMLLSQCTTALLTVTYCKC